MVLETLTFQENLILQLIPLGGSLIMMYFVFKIIFPKMMNMLGKKQWGLEDRINNCNCERCRNDKKKKFKIRTNVKKWDARRDR